MRILSCTAVRGLFLIALLISTQCLYAGGFFGSKGPESRSLGGASLTLANAWSGLNNQAMLADLSKLQIGASVTSLYSISQLTETHVSAAIPIEKAGAIALSVTHFGITDLYTQQKFGLGFGRNFGPNFKAGLQFSALRLDLANYGQKWLLLPELGIVATPSESLSLGFHVFNPFGADLADFTAESIPIMLRVGGKYTISDELSFYGEVSSSTDQDARLHMGLAYQLNDKIALRTGFSTRALVSSFGMQLNLKKIQIHLAFAYHQSLGSTPELGMAYVAD